MSYRRFIRSLIILWAARDEKKKAAQDACELHCRLQERVKFNMRCASMIRRGVMDIEPTGEGRMIYLGTH